MYRVKFSEESGRLVARIALPAPDGAVTVATHVALSDLEDEVKTWIAAHPRGSVGDDLALLQKCPEISRRVGHHRLIRKLHDSVGAWPGGPVTEGINALAAQILEDARGAHGTRQQIALRKMTIISNEAQRKVPSAAIALAALRRVNQASTTNVGDNQMPHSHRHHNRGQNSVRPSNVGDSTEVGGIWSKIKTAAKGVVKAGKVTDEIVTQNPLARTLVSTVPGGAAALAANDYGKQTLKVIKAAKSGNPKALESIEELKKEAAGGNKQAQDALLAMRNVNANFAGGKYPPPAAKPPKGSSFYLRGARAGVNPSVWG